MPSPQVYLLFGKRLILFGTSPCTLREIVEELVEDVFVRLWANRQQITEIDNSDRLPICGGEEQSPQ